MLIKENMLIKEARIIKENIIIKKSKGGLNARNPLICTYKRKREKKEKTHRNSKGIQFLIEGKH